MKNKRDPRTLFTEQQNQMKQIKRTAYRTTCLSLCKSSKERFLYTNATKKAKASAKVNRFFISSKYSEKYFLFFYDSPSSLD